MNISLQEKTYKIIGACMETHRYLGNGFHESVYQEAVEIELRGRNVPCNREAKLTIDYKGMVLKKHYYADFICFNEIILEIKAVSNLADEHVAQVLNYLKTSHFKIGLLVNFGTPSLTYRRLIF